MGWNYRLLKYNDDEYGLHEVYYDDKNKPVSCTKDPLFVCNSYKDFFKVLKMMENDIEHYGKDGILDYDSFIDN